MKTLEIQAKRIRVGRDREGLFASLGGWHIPWPEYDAYDDEAGRLVLWTFEGSEPWLEVWQRPSGALQVVPRIS